MVLLLVIICLASVFAVKKFTVEPSATFVWVVFNLVVGTLSYMFLKYKVDPTNHMLAIAGFAVLNAIFTALYVNTENNYDK